MQVVAGAMLGRDGWLIARRAPGDRAYPGCWEFPGGKVDPGEDDETALRREWREELGLDVGLYRPTPVHTLKFLKVDGYRNDVDIRLYVVSVLLLPANQTGDLNPTFNVWPEHLPDHTAALYVSLDVVRRMDTRDCTPSLQPFASALAEAVVRGELR